MKVFAKTDIGRERKINEDFFYISEKDSKIRLYIIADGMGGYNGGEIASKIATESVKQYVCENFESKKNSREEIIELIQNAIEFANSKVFTESEKNEDLKGMGTTLDICLIYNNKMYVGHIGDSRVYRIRKEFLRRITKDHSYVQTLIEDGTITKEEAYHHPKKNMLTKALGCEKKVEPDIYVKTFLPHDILLMCTDGLTNMVRENEIYNIIMENPEDAIAKLINKANENGGLDNVTAIIICNDN